MAIQVQNRRGTTTQHSTFTGASGEITVDTDKNTVVVHNGSTPGGFPLSPNIAFDVANAAFTNANSILVIAQAAFDRANLSNDVLFISAAFDKANAANVLAYNTGIGANNYAGAMANASNAYAASLTPDLSPAFNKANDAFTVANAAFAAGNNEYTFSNTVYAAVNSVFGVANAAFARGNTSAQLAYYRVTVGAVNMDAGSNAGTLIVSSSNNIVLIANSTNDSLQITQSPSGVTATTYGGATQIPVLSVDTYGRITSAANAAVQGMDYAYANTIWNVANAAFNRGNTSAQLAFFRVAANGSNLDAVSNADTLTIRSSNNIILIANSTNDSIQITQNPSGVSSGSYSSGISAITVDAFGRITSITGSAGYVTSSGVTSITAGTGLSGGTITSSGTISMPSVGPGAGTYSSGISSITIDAQGRITSITGSAGYVTSSGVTSVSGTSGRITSSGGTTPVIDLATSGVSATTYGGATNIPAITVDAYGRITSASNVAVSSGGLTVSDQTSSSSTFYPLFTTTTSGSASVANVATTKLYFVPSTGTLSATVFTSLSDIEYKTDIQQFNGANLLDSINPVSFVWKETGTKSYGVIAQELEKVLPELVETNENGTKSVSYTPMIAILLNVVKDLTARIEELERK